MEIDDYRSQIKLSPYYEFIRKNHEQLEGDILEVGVYRGKSLLSTAMLLKELGSDKRYMGSIVFQVFHLFITKTMTLALSINCIQAEKLPTLI